MNLRVILMLLSALLVLPLSGVAEVRIGTSPSAAELKRKTLRLNAAVAGGILAWDMANWDYFQTAPKSHGEKWFGHGTREGGRACCTYLFICTGEHPVQGL